MVYDKTRPSWMASGSDPVADDAPRSRGGGGGGGSDKPKPVKRVKTSANSN